MQPIRLLQQQAFISLKKGQPTLRLMLALVVSLLALPGMAVIRYVTPTGSGTGSGNSWANASSSLTAVLDAANAGDEVWVKTGTYRRYDEYAFQIKNGVKLYGGFAGNETSLGGRSSNVSANPVYITNSPTASGTNSTNYDKPVFQIIGAGSGSLIDRITIDRAFTSAAFYDKGNGELVGIGAAIYLRDASPVINNVTFSNCTAEFKGGAVYMTNSSPSFTSCTFSNNSCLKEAGGAVWAMNNSRPTFTNTTFSNNYSIVPQGGGSDAVGRGGAIYLRGGKLTLANVTFTDNRSKLDAGAVYLENSTENSLFNNVVFENNKSGYTTGFSNQGEGGAITSNTSSYSVTNCVFFNNRAGGNGGAIYNVGGAGNNLVPKITNVFFYSNGTGSNMGGAIANDRSSPLVTNCTFVDNYCGSAQGAGGIYSFSTVPSSFVDNPKPIVANCIFKRNGYVTATSGGLAGTVDIAQTPSATTTVTYSIFKETSSFSGAGNISIADAPNPFVNESSVAAAKGADGIWMTADDGFHPFFCNRTAIDKGNNTAISDATTIITDLGGQPRRINVLIVPDSGATGNTAPIVDMGAYENQETRAASDLVGSIGNAHTIPTPQELSSDFVTSTQSPISGAIISWEQQPLGNSSWVPATPASSDFQYRIPALAQTTSYRRVATLPAFCNTAFSSNVVTIRVVEPNGAINGKVISRNGTGVEGILITAVRKTAVPGGPIGTTYTDTTDAAGDYSITPIYYGDKDSASARATFTITPSREGRGFNIPNIDKELTKNIPQINDVRFTDTTALTITGRTYQLCLDCNTLTGATETQTCPIDSIDIYKDNLLNTRTGFIDSAYGRYTVSVTDRETIRIEPRRTGRIFRPVFRNVLPVNNLSGIDFRDSTYHTITGRLTAGCGEYIGTAVLEFSDSLPRNADNSARNSCFRKRVGTEAGTGRFSITLPARMYKVRVVSFAPTSGQYPVDGTVVADFINTKLSSDSLFRDISLRDTTLNLVYVRPPVVELSGLTPICFAPDTFSLIKQGAIDSFKVFVYQGPKVLGCPLADTINKIRILTNVQQEDQLEELFFAVRDTGTKVLIRGGIPNIVDSPGYLKNMFIYFKDRYNRTANDFNRKVLVTGVKADPATFTTVSPEVPLVVLHDPPGDASSSTWQRTQSISNAVRFYTAAGAGVEAWAEAKIGAATTLGILGAFFDVSVWGSIRGSIGVNSTITSSNEAILTATTSQAFSTSGNPEVTGSNGDVYIGAALNLIYSVATEIKYVGCGNITKTRKLIIANNGFNTQYIYSEDYITNTLIPNLQSLAALSTIPAEAARYLNQVKVWQQVVENNAENKRRASFVQNYSFDGSAGPYTNTTTTSSSKSSSLEFAVEVNAAVATELGFEVAGAGVSGGLNVNFRMETGGSTTNTTTDETTIGYTLDDNTPGDFFSVNVKKDPVYNTPVFELAAGTASCPTEPGAQPRDAIFFTANNPVVQNVNPALPANFNLKIVNTSASTSTNPNDKRVYKLSYVQSTNTANETITIAGTPYNSSSPYVSRPLGYLDSVIVPISITRQNGSSVYSYEGEQFTVSSSCDEDLGKTVSVSAYFTSPCSSITLTQPADGWVLNASGSNRIFIKPAGYALSGLNSVNVQFAPGNSSSWSDGPFLDNTQLADGFYFDVASLPDGPYSIRLRLDCNNGTVFSSRATGIIDRRAPQLFGRPTPTDDRYTNGETISFTYDEKPNTNTNNLQVTIRRLGSNTLIPATASIFDNKLVIVPNTPIASLTNDSIRIIVSGISDMYGNVKTSPDTTGFVVGVSTPDTTNKALYLTVSNPRVYKNNDTGAIRIIFNLPAPATNDTRVNYTIGGTARYGIDYSASYPITDALYASFNGSTGSIRIPKGSRTATLTLKPIFGDTAYSPDKTIIISTSEGGDYALGTPTSVTGTLTTEDGVNVYTFTGDGNWNIRNNWQNGRIPLTTLVSGKEIVINPSGTCILNVPQTIKPGAKITVKQNRRFLIQGFLKQQN